ncbi:CIC11C00000005015 [Sungouiella intermedia]|uniref:CIC11C00000005015 n=1 Tax=Sungouiella intermedia TaxID=45354 RepID=A0A1L0BD65_9ASCO|nr:CIC11C00000005015 [[Candida] intermedia]
MEWERREFFPQCQGVGNKESEDWCGCWREHGIQVLISRSVEVESYSMKVKLDVGITVSAG